MVGRRELFGGGMVAGLAALTSGETVAAQQEGTAAVARAVDDLRRALERRLGCDTGDCPAVAAIRQQLNTYLKSNQKFPEFIDAGLDVWNEVFDWHVRNQRPIDTRRLADGRYGITFMFTTVVLKPENTPGYLSFGYDAR